LGKRGNGEGTISRRKNGGWMAQYYVHTAQGRKRKTIYGKTRKEVAKKLAKALSDREGGLIFDAEGLKLREYLSRWLEDSVKDTVRNTTYEGYEQIARTHIIPMLGDVKLKGLSPTHVRGLYKEKLQTLSPRTVQYIHVTLHKALKQAVNDGLIPRNATEAVKPPQVRREEIRPLTPEQVKMLLDAASEAGDRLEALYVLAVHTGLRQGELLGLKWEDVDLESGSLHVKRTLTTARGGPRLAAPKTKGSRRRVSLTKGAVDALRAHLARQLEEIDRAGSLWQENGLVFASETGEPLDRRDLTSRQFKPLLERAKLPEKTRFHDLRHTCATLLLTKNVNPKVVSEMLGHSNIAITLDTYSHVLPNMQDSAARALEEALR
jgi:integrase